jgi:DNA-binding MarR family transcriptional regulator
MTMVGADRPRVVCHGGQVSSSPPGGWLNAEQQQAWVAFMRLQLRMTYEMNRQLQADNAVSLPDYHVLTALGGAPDATMSVTSLAAEIGWERSRASHHCRRMASRQLVVMAPAARDRRVTEVSLTADGRAVLSAAAPGHVELVRRLFFDGLDPRVVRGLAQLLETVYENVLDQGSLRRPPTG